MRLLLLCKFWSLLWEKEKMEKQIYFALSSSLTLNAPWECFFLPSVLIRQVFHFSLKDILEFRRMKQIFGLQGDLWQWQRNVPIQSATRRTVVVSFLPHCGSWRCWLPAAAAQLESMVAFPEDIPEPKSALSITPVCAASGWLAVRAVRCLQLLFFFHWIPNAFRVLKEWHDYL